MENEYIKIAFLSEEKEITLDYNQPDLTRLIRFIIQYNLDVTKENITVESDIDDFDNEDFKSILIEAHAEFRDELESFYSNISSIVSTHYDVEGLSDEIIRRVTTPQNTESTM